ncbi:MAG: hypothetical protein GC202_05520 [Alphaproteobacteria bacterium]|nr:hypothetical protein [Alphaproteobacteria bacterium]
MKAALVAGGLYAAIVFAAGFAFGVLRVVATSSGIDEGAALAIEIPVMLALAWFVCGRILARIPVGASYDARATMGLSAFTLLQVAEFVTGAVFFDQSLAAMLAKFDTPEGAAGLVAQAVFGAIPLFRR